VEELNNALFMFINAPAQPNGALLFIAKFLAEQTILFVPFVLVVGWLMGRKPSRKILFGAALAGLLGLLLSQIMGLLWPHPRPFMIGVGHTFIEHVADSSFPSDHLTLMWAVSLSFLPYSVTRFGGAMLTLLALPVAWARIYIGVHYPFDMIGALIVASFSAWFIFWSKHWLSKPVFRAAYALFTRLFAPLIRRGWISR
jgi:undecaprenyl-diphosphatase